MTASQFSRENHYVPCVYLKLWESSNKRVWAYRILVSHENVPLWKQRSIRGIAYHSHLYTRMAAGRESDEIEQLFARNYETPAEDALKKATSDDPLTPSDWRVLVRFLAAQHLRTPARLVESLLLWQKTMPSLLQNALQEAAAKLEQMKSRGEIPPSTSSFAEYIPFRVRTEIKPGHKLAKLEAKTVVGRGMWLFAIKHMLTKTDVLHEHKWTILSPPTGMTWFTSDDPVVCLNFNDPENYNFGGGWISKGTEIFMPLSPRHLLYTQVGKRPPLRGTRCRPDLGILIRRFIAEHAHRIIFAAEPDMDVPKLRPRLVNADLIREERKYWSKWHEDQAIAERALIGWAESSRKRKEKKEP